jgi:hypothetical protein
MQLFKLYTQRPSETIYVNPLNISYVLETSLMTDSSKGGVSHVGMNDGSIFTCLESVGSILIRLAEMRG